MAAVATLGVEVKANGVKATADDLDRFAVNAGKAEVGAKGLERESKNLTSGLGGLGGALGKVASLMGVAFSVVAIKNAADSFSDLNSRVALAVGGYEKGAAVMERLRSVAKNTYSDLNSTTESFIANSGVLKELGKSTSQALDFTEALNNAFVVSGAKGDRAASVQNALSKAMALGKLSGDNLNTVIASGGRVTEALAKELGVSTLQLRKLGAEGKITGDVIYNSMVKNLETLRDEAGSMPATMGDAGTAISNMFLTIVGAIDGATGASEGLAQYIYDSAYTFAGYADEIAKYFVAAQIIIQESFAAISGAISSVYDWLIQVAGEANVTGTAMAVGIGLATTASLALAAALAGPVVSAISAVTAAMLLNPIGLLVTGFATAIAAAYIFRDEIKDIIGVDLIGVVKDSVNVIIGTFVGGYEAMKLAWNNLPAAIEATMVATANGVVKAVEWMINKIIDLFNSMFDGIRGALSYIGVEIGEIGKADLSGMMLEASASAQVLGDSMSTAMNSALAKDYVGEVTGYLNGVMVSAGEATAALEDMNAALAGDAITPSGGGAAGDAGKKKKGGKQDKTANDMEKRLEQLKSSLAGENEARLQAYVKDMETLKWYLDNKKMTEDEYNQWKKRVEGEAFEKSLTDQELLTLQHQQELEALQMFFDQKKLTEEEYLRWQEEINTQHAEKMRALTVNQWTGALDSMGDLMGAMASMQSSGNEKMLKAQRIFAAASALISTYEGAAKALSLGFPQGIPAMLAVLAKGMSLVAAIRSGSKSASGGGSAGGTTATAAPPPTKPQQMAEIKIHGEVFGRDQVIDLVEKINDVQKDGHMINWSYA